MAHRHLLLFLLFAEITRLDNEGITLHILRTADLDRTRTLGGKLVYIGDSGGIVFQIESGDGKIGEDVVKKALGGWELLQEILILLGRVAHFPKNERIARAVKKNDLAIATLRVGFHIL